MIKKGWNDTVTDQEYHADQEWITASRIKLAADDLALYEHYYLKGNERTRTAAMEVGSVIHHMLADQRDNFAVFVDGKVRRGKAYEDFASRYPKGHLIVTDEVYQQARDAVLKLREDELFQSLQEQDGIREKVFAWEDEEWRCKFKPDLFLPKAKLVVDYKTVSQFSEHKIKRQFAELKYHLQAAHYLIGATEAVDGKHSCAEFDVWFFFIETQAPYRTACLRLDEDDMERSLDMRERILHRLRRAMIDRDYREHFNKTLQTISLPEYAYHD
jgi:hypothetical protein